jgi:hypothetical protein
MAGAGLLKISWKRFISDKAGNMEPLVCTAYYPHNRLRLLIREAVFPMLEKIKNYPEFYLLNFRLSAYKGENIILWFDCSDANSREKLRDYINAGMHEFIVARPATNDMPAEFPLRKLFMDIPPNSIHFWDKHPFKAKTFSGSDAETDRQVQSLVSRQCLNHLYNSRNDFGQDLYKLYIQLIIIFSLVCYGNTAHLPDIANRVLLKVKSLKKNSLEGLRLLEGKYRNEYFRHRLQTDRQVSEMIRLFRFPVNSNDNFLALDWVKLFKEIENIRTSKSSADQRQFYSEIFIEISQKLSLVVDELIKAMVILDLFFGEDVMHAE